jgi:Alginate lyase
MLAIGVFTDDHVMFDKAVNWYYNGTDNGTLTHYIINDTGQCQESGRDQTHTQLGLGFMAESSEIGWNQGLDMYGASSNRLLKGFEYTASYNLGNDVPFVEYTDSTGKYHQTAISTANRGEFRPIYEMVYNHYQHRRTVPCPYAQQVAAQLRPEGAAFQTDHPGFGTLLFTR